MSVRPPLEMRRYGTAGPPGNLTGAPNPRPTPSRAPAGSGRLPVPLRPMSSHGRRHDAAGRGNAPPAVFQKNRDTAISLAARLIELRPRRKPGGLRQEYGRQVAAEDAFDGAGVAAVRNAELGGLWTRTRRGRTELKVIRNAAGGTAPGAFGPWAEVIDRAWQLGAQHPVSDGDGAIAAGIELVLCRGSAAPAVRVSPVAGVPAEHWDDRVCGGAAVVGRGQSGGRSGMGAAGYAGDGQGGALLV